MSCDAFGLNTLCVVAACNHAVVDTGAHYMGGTSETMVADVVDRWLSSAEGEGKSCRLISKFGYASVRLCGASLRASVPHCAAGGKTYILLGF